MDYREMYQEKLVSAEKAAGTVKSGDWVDYGWAVVTPVAVDAALAERMPQLTDVKRSFVGAEDLRDRGSEGASDMEFVAYVGDRA